MPFNRPWPGKQRPLEQTEITAYLPLFTDEQSLEFTITPAVKFKSVVIRPISAGKERYAQYRPEKPKLKAQAKCSR